MNNDSFGVWYSDAPKFNKRIGYRQPVFQVASGGSSYEFDASNSTHNALGNGLFDPITLYGLSSLAWPMSKFEKDIIPSCGPGCIKGKYWFTTELHSNFQYNGGEQFSFSGDDDVHVFINGRLAINLGGVHSITPATISLDTYAKELNISKGGVYSFDMFHAERQTKGSNFKLTTTLVEACNVVSSSTRNNASDVTLGINWVSGRLEVPSTNEWFLLGGPGFAAPSLPLSSYFVTLMKPNVPDVVSYMFSRSQQNIGSGFSLSFSFRMSGNGHGFALVLHDRALGLRDFNGGSGPNLGIKNIHRSFALLFDACPSFPDCSQGMQLRLHYKADGNRMNSNSIGTRSVYDSNVQQNWRDGQIHNVQINYYAVPDWLEVYVDESLRLVERSFDVLKVVGNRNAYVGFTSSSSLPGQGMTVEVGQVSVKTIKVSSKLSQLVNVTLPLPLVADGKQAGGVLIQTRDACFNAIRFGGLASLAKGRAIIKVFNTTTRRLDERHLQAASPSDVTQDAEIVDNSNGTYSVLLRTNLQGSASLYLAFGESCTWNGTKFIGDDDCWSTFIPDAVSLVAPPTQPPTYPGQDTDSIPFPWQIVIYVGIGLGGLLICCCCLIFFFMRYRSKWRKNKKFVKSGQLALLDSQIELDKNPAGAKMEQLAHKLQETKQEVLKLRAISRADEAPPDIEVWASETKKLKDEVKDLKRRQMEGELMQISSSKRTLARDDEVSTRRISFAPEPVNSGYMPSAGEILASLPAPPPNFIVPVFVGRNNPKATFLVSLPRRDVDDMIGLANDNASVMCGGELFGQSYDNGDVLVMHSTGPGYSSLMERDKFAQSVVFVREATAYLAEHSAFRIGSWISTSVHGKPVSEVLRLAHADVRRAVPDARYVYVLLVQLCGVKQEKMIVTITPYRYTLGDESKTQVGDLYVFDDDADADATRRHEALEVFRSRPPPPPPSQPLTSQGTGLPPPLPPSRVPSLPPNKRRLGEAPMVEGPPVPPRPPPPRVQPPPGLGGEMALSPRRLSVAEDDENPLVPVIMDGSVDDRPQPAKSGFRFFGGRS